MVLPSLRAASQARDGSYTCPASSFCPTLSKNSNPPSWAEPRPHALPWLARFFCVPKPLPQRRQTKVRSLECTDIRCRFKSVLSRNSLAQLGHCIFLQLKWMVFSCRSMFDFSVKLAGHLEHWKRASWPGGTPSARPGRQQSSRSKGRSMEKACSWMCSFSSSARWNTLLQKPHVSLLARAVSRLSGSVSSDLEKLVSEMETHAGRSVRSGIKQRRLEGKRQKKSGFLSAYLNQSYQTATVLGTPRKPPANEKHSAVRARRDGNTSLQPLLGPPSPRCLTPLLLPLRSLPATAAKLTGPRFARFGVSEAAINVPGLGAGSSPVNPEREVQANGTRCRENCSQVQQNWKFSP